jgi:hypothetical protein
MSICWISLTGLLYLYFLLRVRSAFIVSFYKKHMKLQRHLQWDRTLTVDVYGRYTLTDMMGEAERG